jgi:hypothetical protein
MREKKKIDFAQLLGFEVMSGELSDNFDFRDETFAGRLGAKVGDKDMTLLNPPRKKPRPERGSR